MGSNFYGEDPHLSIHLFVLGKNFGFDNGNYGLMKINYVWVLKVDLAQLESKFPRRQLHNAGAAAENMEHDDGNGGDEERTVYDSPDGDQMTTFSLHYFGESPDDEDGCSIQIIENMKEEYGMFVWPCSIALAEYVWQQRSRFSETSVLELGAGTSLPGLVAAKLGAKVTLTDDSSRVEVLENISSVCDLNRLHCEVVGLTWGVWDAQIFDLHPQIILGADVLYEASAFDNLFSTVAFLLQKNPGSVFITTYHNRSGHHLIEFLMVKWDLKCVKLLDAFSFMPSDKAYRLGGNIQLAEIVLDNQKGKASSVDR